MIIPNAEALHADLEKNYQNGLRDADFIIRNAVPILFALIGVNNRGEISTDQMNFDVDANGLPVLEIKRFDGSHLRVQVGLTYSVSSLNEGDGQPQAGEVRTLTTEQSADNNTIVRALLLMLLVAQANKLDITT